MFFLFFILRDGELGDDWGLGESRFVKSYFALKKGESVHGQSPNMFPPVVNHAIIFLQTAHQ